MTNTDITTDRLTDLVDAHLGAYCDPDAARRAEAVAATWTADGVLQDPPFEAEGHDGIAGATDLVLGHYAGHRFERTTDVDVHHGTGRYGWALVAPSGETVLTGTDVVTFREDRIARIVGFFGDLPARG